jgi:Mg-chelatase subunit ChlD
MKPATTRRPSEGGLFARELSRAIAQRGRLDPVYQALSDDWTLILQRLFPVWSVVGPGLADPGHIELTSRTVYLDSDSLLGSRQQIVTGTLEPHRILATFGVGIHEVLHAKHTKLWVSDRDAELADSEDADERQLAVDRQLLEEPRMEANGVREFPEGARRGKFIRRAIGAAAVEVILPRLTEALMLEAVTAGAVSRDLAGRSMVYLKARCHYGVCDPARLGPLPGLWAHVLGAVDVGRLDDLFARLIWADDGDNAALDRYATEYRQIIGPPPPPGGGQGEGRTGQGAAGPGQGQDSGNSTEQGAGAGAQAANGEAEQQVTPRSLGEALTQAIREQRHRELELLNEDLDLQTLLKAAANTEPPKSRGRGTRMPTGRLPDRGVDRPPMSDEVRMARQYARRMHQAREVGLKRIDKRTPGGRFNARAHMRAHAQRTVGAPVIAHPWEITKIVTAPLQEPHVGLVIDTSGSMGSYEYALGPIAWVLSTGLREFGGRLAIALFGNGAELLTEGSEPLRLIPGIRTGGGTAFGGDALCVCTEHLEFENPRRPRFQYVVSDGGWYDTQAGVAKIHQLRELGVPTVHISIGLPPLAVDADRIVTIEDPATAMDIVAADTVAALRARRGRR